LQSEKEDNYLKVSNGKKAKELESGLEGIKKQIIENKLEIIS
jgi:hypothetical protein